MIALNLRVISQSIEVTSSLDLVAGSVGIYEAQFEFNEAWTGFSKTAVFQLNNTTDPTEMVIVDNACEIPHEALAYSGTMRVGVYGTSGTDVMPTVWTPTLIVHDGTIVGSIYIEPTESTYEQVMDMLAGLAGGASGKILAKHSYLNYDFEWVDDPSGGVQAVKYVEQELSEEDQAQARTNIGAAPAVVPDSTPGNVVVIGSNQNIVDSGKSFADIYDSAMIHKTASGSIVTIEDGADDVPIKQMTVQIEPVQAGSGDPSPSNVRAISGWTKSKIKRHRRNLLYGTSEGDAYHGITMTRNADGSYHVSGTPTSSITTRMGIKGSTPIQLPQGTYTVSVNSDFGGTGTSTYRMYYEYHVPNTETWSGTTLISGSTAKTIVTDAIRNFRLQIYQTTAIDITIKPQIEVGSVAHAFESYIIDCNTYEIEFPTEAGTVYGGELTIIEDGSGTLTVDKGIWIATTSNTSRSSDNLFTSSHIADMVNTASQSAAGILSNKFKSYTGSGADNRVYRYTDVIYMRPSTGYSSVSAFITAFDPIQVVYPLATPVVYQLTAPQVSTLLGLNNIWADTGDISVTYRADPTIASEEQAKAIKESIAYVQNDFTAVQPYVVNDLVYVGDTLYIVSSSIAQGATMTPNTNCAETTLNAVIKSLR